jgi:hypothetical protein
MSSKAYKHEDYLNVGEGVEAAAESDNAARFTFDEAYKGKQQVVEEPPEVVVSKDVDWADTPTYADQFEKYPSTTRTVGPKFKSFDMSKPEEEEALDKFINKTLPAEAPQIVVIETEKKFCDSTENWKLLLSYYQVQYRKILDKGR